MHILLGAARGLDYLHSFKIVHRDIKPANILLHHNYEPKVADFGLLRVTSGDSASLTRIMGTPGYIDPAFSKSQKAHPSLDIYR